MKEGKNYDPFLTRTWTSFSAIDMTKIKNTIHIYEANNGANPHRGRLTIVHVLVGGSRKPRNAKLVK